MSVSTFKTFFVKRKNCLYKQFSYTIDDDFTLEVEEDPEDAQEEKQVLKIAKCKTEVTHILSPEKRTCDNLEPTHPPKIALTDEENVNVREKYQCYKTDHLQIYKLHMEAHQKPPEYIPCPKCPFRAPNKAVLTIHRARCEGTEKKFYCPHCKFVTVKVKFLNRHLRRIHPANPLYSCPECPFKTVNLNLADKHKKCHEEKRNSIKYKCHCGFGAAKKQILEEHRRLLHRDESRKVQETNGKRYQCGLCNFQSMQRSKIKRHHLVKHVGKDMNVMSVENVLSK